MDEKRLKDYALKISTNCNKHTNCRGCPFYREIHAGWIVKGVCILYKHEPDKWEKLL